MPKIIFEQIPGLIGSATELPFEMTLSHPDLDLVRKALTVENKAIKYQITRAKKTMKAKKAELEGMESVAEKTGKIDKNRYTKLRAQVDNLEATIAELMPDLYKRFYGENDDNTLNAPSGFHWMCEKIVDRTHLNTEVSFVPWPESTGKPLRPYQEDSVKAALQYRRSSISLPTGTGKSLIIFALVNCYLAKGKRVCILEPTIELVKQMYEEAKTYFSKVSGLGGVYKYQPENMLLISTVQSAGAYIDRYDVVIVDEFHHSACTTVEDTLFSAVNAEYVHGFTACPIRADGMTLGIHAACGPVVYEQDTRWALDKGYLTRPSIAMVKIATGKKYPDFMNAAKVYGYLTQHDLTMKTILSILMKNVNKGRRVLVMFKTVEESFAFKKYAESTISVEVASSEYRGGLYKFKNKECNVLVANSGLMAEGVDVPGITGLISATQMSSENMTRQILGRGLRLLAGKTDVFFCDITTMGFSQFERAYEARKKVYLTIVDDIKELTITSTDI